MRLIVFSLLLLPLAGGCISKSKADAKARAAFAAGQQQALMQQSMSNTVVVGGAVRNRSIPWTDDLTLARAIVAADYTGAGDPSQIIILRPGQRAISINAQEILHGFDMPLQPGDRIEIRP